MLFNFRYIVFKVISSSRIKFVLSVATPYNSTLLLQCKLRFYQSLVLPQKTLLLVFVENKKSTAVINISLTFKTYETAEKVFFDCFLS